MGRKAQHKARLEDIIRNIAELQETSNRSCVQMAEIDENRPASAEQLAEGKGRRSGLTSERKVLAIMEARRQGLSKTVREILSQKQQAGQQYDYIDGIVADVLHADTEYAAAVEAARRA